MDKHERAVYIQAMIACAMIELEGMRAENALRAINGQSPAYGQDSFESLVTKYGIHHNAVVGFLGGE